MSVRPREISVVVNGQLVENWKSGSIESSLITPADQFILRVPSSLTAWNTLRRDSRVSIRVDGVTMLDGFIDKRRRDGANRVIEIGGRDRVGRVVDTSAPAIDYSGLTILEAARRLLSPWFEPSSVIISNAKNRRIRRGKGNRVAAGNEPVVTFNVRVPRRGKVHPGETRWQLLKEILSRAGLIGYSSADGKEFIIGQPNQTQEPQYTFIFGKPDSTLVTNVRDVEITEDDGERFSMYMCGGVGGQSDVNFGKNVIQNGVAFDNPFNRIDGTGRDFIHPKPMYLPERAFESFHDAANVAALEKARRDYKRHLVSLQLDDMGQEQTPGEITFFAPDTMCRFIDEEIEIDDKYLVVSCSFNFSRDGGDWTTVHIVPQGTEIII